MTLKIIKYSIKGTVRQAKTSSKTKKSLDVGKKDKKDEKDKKKYHQSRFLEAALVRQGDGKLKKNGMY